MENEEVKSLVPVKKYPREPVANKIFHLIENGEEALEANNIEKALICFQKAEYSEGIDDIIVSLLRSGRDQEARNLFNFRKVQNNRA